VDPIALELLQRFNCLSDGLRSKGWDEFQGSAAPPMDFIIRFADQTPPEVGGDWRGEPVFAHWRVANPITDTDDEIERWDAFRTAFRELETRIKVFVSLPIASLDRLRLQERLQEIGQASPTPA
jgi:arsenate reductase